MNMNKKIVAVIGLCLIVLSCSKKVIFYFESSFENVKTNLYFESEKKPSTSFYVIKDSTLSANYSVGLSFYSPVYKLNGKSIKIKMSAIELKLGAQVDTVFYFDLPDKKNSIVFDFKYNFRDSVSLINVEKLEKNDIFL